MPSFITACVVAIVIALGAALVLNLYYQRPADVGYASPTGTRITPETNGHLVTRS
jgi:hypothetical protein